MIKKSTKMDIFRFSLEASYNYNLHILKPVKAVKLVRQDWSNTETPQHQLNRVHYDDGCNYVSFLLETLFDKVRNTNRQNNEFGYFIHIFI